MRDFPYNRVRGRISAWRRIEAPSHVLQWIHTGTPLLWGLRGPPAPFDEGSYPLRSPAEQSAWTMLRAEYLALGAIVKVNPVPESRISRAFLVKKGKEDGVLKYRLCVDLRRVNRHLRKVGLRYEKLRDFGHLLSL